MDKRPAEIEATRKILELLCNEYPDLLELEEYTHPIKGVCTSVIMKSYSSVRVDLENILFVLYDILNNTLSILTDSPKVLYSFKNFIKDETVM